MLHLITNAVAPQKRQAMMIRTASCHGSRKLGMRRRGRRWGLRVRAAAAAGGVRLGLLLRLRVRLSSVVSLLMRGVEELRCRPGGRRATGRWSSPAPTSAVPAQCHHDRRRPEWDQSSFYAEAIADCLEFIKSRSSYCPVNGGRV